MELDCDELWWIAKEKELKLKIDILEIVSVAMPYI